MSLAASLLIPVVALMLVSAVTAVLLAVALERRGVRTPLPLVGALVFRNLRLYEEMTRRETGRVGPLYLSYVVPVNAALLLALLALVLHAAT